MRSIKPSVIVDEITSNALADISTMIWGEPGVGKTAIGELVAKNQNALLYTLHANLYDPVDVRGGLKVVEQSNGTYLTKYGIPEDYPPTDYTGPVVLLIDDLPNASKDTMSALQSLCLLRKIGTYQLPRNTTIIAAGNRTMDRANVHEMPTPVKNRFAHYLLEADLDDWVTWAYKNDIDSSIISFLRFRPTLLSTLDARENAFPTPRAWEMLSKKLPYAKDMFYCAASVVGDGAAGEYIAHRNIYKDLPDIDKLIANPGTTKVPDEPSWCHAIVSALCMRVTEANFVSISRYIQRMHPQYQIVFMQDALSKTPELRTSDVFQTWVQKNAEVLI